MIERYVKELLSICSLADHIGVLTEKRQELEALPKSLDKTCRGYKMEVSAEKTSLMMNNTDGILREIKVKWLKLGSATSFKYLGAVVLNKGLKPEVLSWTVLATAVFKKLKAIWRDNGICLLDQKCH